jgi:hypothetical protein
VRLRVEEHKYDNQFGANRSVTCAALTVHSHEDENPVKRTIFGLFMLLALAACGPIGGTEPDNGGGSGGTSASNASGGSTGSAGARPANPNGKQSLIWIWQNYSIGLANAIANANSFTHVSPALYQLNYAYQSGVAQGVNANGVYNGLTGKDMAAQLHAAGLKMVPLMYAGAGNHGVDDGIQSILNNPAVAQNFITAHVQEAVANDYDGWNLDWEVLTTTYDQYGANLITFLTAFKTALHAQNMELSLDLGGWYVKQCTASGGSGLVDLAALGPAVDQAIIEDYAGTFDGSTDKCPSPVPSEQDCSTFGNGLSVMCGTTNSVVMIGLIAPGTNTFADQALGAISSYGFKSVALWPDDSPLLDSRGIPNGGTWYSVLGTWLAD